MVNPIDRLRNLDLSKWHFYSFGIVVDYNKCDNIAHIFPIEKQYGNEGLDLQSQDGSIIVTTDLNKSKHNDKIKKYVLDTSSDEETYKEIEIDVELEHSRLIIAKWAHLSQSNRTTPPCLSPGETVMLFRFSNNDEYYWETLKSDIINRKGEKAIWEYYKYPGGSYKLDIDTEQGKMEVNIGIKKDNGDCIDIITGEKIPCGNYSGSDIKDDIASYTITIDVSRGQYTMVKDNDNCNENHILFDTISGSYFLNMSRLLSFNTNGQIELHMKKILIDNGKYELIHVLIELVKTILLEQHVGNLGLPTKLTSDSVEKYQKILEKLQTFATKKSNIKDTTCNE